MFYITLSLICCKVNSLHKNACHISLTAPLKQRHKAYHSCHDPDVNQDCCGPDTEYQSLYNHCAITATWSAKKKSYIYFLWDTCEWSVHGKEKRNLTFQWLNIQVKHLGRLSDLVDFEKTETISLGKKTQDEKKTFLAYYLKCIQSTRNVSHKPLERALFASCREKQAGITWACYNAITQKCQTAGLLYAVTMQYTCIVQLDSVQYICWFGSTVHIREVRIAASNGGEM